MTVDGFVGGTKGEQNWLEPNQDDEFKKYYQNEIMNSVDTLLMGRKMTEVFISYWENIVTNQPDGPGFLFAQKLVNIPYGKSKIDIEHTDIRAGLKNAETKLGKYGRVLLRYSGTEPVIRIMVEAENHELVDEVISELTDLIQTKIDEK